MKPVSKATSVVRAPQILAIAGVAWLALGTSLAWAGPHGKGGKGGKGERKGDKGTGKPTPADTTGAKKGKDAGKPVKPPTLDFTGLNFQGQLHTPQLLYFLDRASEELDRASLERRSFIPEMVSSVDEDDL